MLIITFVSPKLNEIYKIKTRRKSIIIQHLTEQRILINMGCMSPQMQLVTPN